MKTWTNAQHRKFRATMKERAAQREVQEMFENRPSRAVVVSQRAVVTEVKVGSEITFTLGDLKVVVKAVE